MIPIEEKLPYRQIAYSAEYTLENLLKIVKIEKKIVKIEKNSKNGKKNE